MGTSSRIHDFPAFFVGCPPTGFNQKSIILAFIGTIFPVIFAAFFVGYPLPVLAKIPQL